MKFVQIYSFGIFAAAIAATGFSVSFAGCHNKEIYTPTPSSDIITNDTIPATKTFTYMALGDSYTIGQSVPEEDRYPVQIAAILNADSINIGNPDIIAVTGWTTQNLLAGIAQANPAKNYDIVTLLIGVNNQYQTHDTTGYRDQFKLCLDKAIELAAGNRLHVFVLSIPDYSVTPFGQGSSAYVIAEQIDHFNQINKLVTDAYGISYIDVTTASRLALTDPTLICPDGLHPSGKEYKVWAELLAPKMKVVLH